MSINISLGNYLDRDEETKKAIIRWKDFIHFREFLASDNYRVCKIKDCVLPKGCPAQMINGTFGFYEFFINLGLKI